DRKKSGLVKIQDAKRRNRENVNLMATITPDGVVKGSANFFLIDYARNGLVARYGQDTTRYRDALVQKNKAIQIDSVQVKGLEADTLALQESFGVAYTLTQNGSYYLLNHNLFSGMDKNVFTSKYRFSNIDFGSAYSYTSTSRFTLPENFAVESLPKSTRMALPGNDLFILRSITQNGTTLQVDYLVEFNQSEFYPEQYEGVKEFYKKMIDLLNEPVVLKKKS
ncbi:MAG TPA: hypothetical protein VHK69_15570, partial [Chitinophagaceae bacterium]|nr:hypothetical protein [Chitinophagaceae bacterium]